MRAMIRSAPPQAGQISISLPKTHQWQVNVRLQPLIRARYLAALGRAKIVIGSTRPGPAARSAVARDRTALVIGQNSPQTIPGSRGGLYAIGRDLTLARVPVTLVRPAELRRRSPFLNATLRPLHPPSRAADAGPHSAANGRGFTAATTVPSLIMTVTCRVPMSAANCAV